MTKIAYVFPGQGSQAVGMGIDLQDLPIAKEKFSQAEEILGWSVLEICQGEEDKLSRTLYTQPCLYTVESILVDLLKEKGQQGDLVAGHSLGEYVALYAAGVFDFESGLRLVKRRGELMDSAAGGKMVALMKFKREDLDKEIENNPEVVIANDNSEAQVVISGTPDAVDELLTKVKAQRAVELKVSGAFHSPLMAEAAKEFQQVLNSINFSDAQMPVLSNVDPSPTVNATELKQRLLQQMTGGVRWREIMLQLPSLGINRVIEVGPSKVLTGLIKRTCKEIELKNVSSLEDVNQI
jgi:[acyl-carrier-protein] S-malonyltransferase